MILAGDVGATKTVLALVDLEAGVTSPIREERFLNSDFDSLEAVLEEFLTRSEGASADAAGPTVASFGIAGPVAGRQVRITNLPWIVDADAVASTFEIPEVRLLNDLQATAMAVPHLRPGDVHVLVEGRRNPAGAIGVVAPGTGLGEAFLTPVGDGYHAWPTEGGHATFAPATPDQVELLVFLQERYGHVSQERVCSGSGIPNLYDYLLSTGRFEEPDWLRDGIAGAEDPTPLIMDAARQSEAPICVAVLDLFVDILGGVVRNMALRIDATGGVFLGGGIPPRILSRLEEPDFVAAIRRGRSSEWLATIPVSVILDTKAALHGAARDALARANA